jgi:nucleoside-triphosphatase THEP1
VKQRSIKIGVAGTHSTGKSTFLSTLTSTLNDRGFVIGGVSDLASRASDLGFPILADHTFESTLWIMAECMRQEAELSLTCDVILVDRPVPDALG